ncbi:hypothetical protein Desaci_0190 [Desulfosporosinus acidiphilus SJ4]|uniref:Uncharacterized protein n=1 Tax=Desulfosporosinus acidiphilus (strain DSM 22704 / JCM 16185 / SJ4) TaxID=646529 RepID=I4D0E2_DESAJ|nr:Imm1 family immunity protein [Desulfosporosinus acidiphilus]AFM39266.1 hypothetical protein Desaci_0190 [Desulfosporosinus acidiphilus SJ4]
MNSKNQYKQIWLETEDEQAMCALINGDKGWLMYLRYNGDSGFSSRNPNYNGDPRAVLEYYLDNGQCDEYPLSWTLPIVEVERALDYFKKEKKPPKFITWHNDSGDNETI